MTNDGGVTGYDEQTRESGTLRRDDASRDELFDLFAHARRRRALAYLRERERPVTVEELAQHVAAAEHAGGETVSAADRKRVVTSLYHVHLPKLVRAGLVSWTDPDERTAVRVTGEGGTLPAELSWLPAQMATTEK
jgi:hypothetical protein